ncbi:actin depolymerization factor/cofilin-like domain-containing protein (plasmid) [Streptomyces globisporus]|uniref:actin-binding ADF family protein n=1 Tax=Streptomyces globisporus TaxID=1908 RepID=UPI002F91040A|nr:actin depolymerization factor/cofilin-like domain-containing protein [Streptomyces globisporus]
MSSGTAVEDSVVQEFQELKTKKTVNTVFYRLSDDLTTIAPDAKGTWTHDELLDKLPKDEPRFVVYDLTYTKEGAQQSKIALISWCPEGTEIKQRMVHSSSYSTLKNMLDGVGIYVQATDLSDVEYDELVSHTR